MRGFFPISTIIVILILFILFYFLSSTSDMFLSSAIIKIVESFNINQNIAAVTLLAFGNGAPDVIASLVASSEPKGLSFAISSVLGSGMFITSFVLGLVVYRGKDILVNSSMFNRNLILYLISLGHLILIGIKKSITIFDSLGFIFIYLLNVFLSFCNRKQQEKDNDLLENEDKNKDIKDINTNIKDDSKSNYKKIELEQKTNPDSDIEYKEYEYLLNQETPKSNEEIFGEIKEDIIKEQNLFIEDTKAYSKKFNENMILARIYLKKNYLYYKEGEWGKISPFRQILYIVIDLPLTFLRELTIPVLENKKWSKTKFCFLPLGNFIFISLVFKCK